MDDELEQLRQKRMSELQKQQVGGYPGDYLCIVIELYSFTLHQSQ